MASAGSSVADLISVPKGGGALKGLGEKFSPDLYTGTGNFSVPIAVPSGRNGLQPKLSLGFSTGGGNGPFGLGWSLGIPGVSRLTSKGIPRYDDRDIFVLSGAEDLVPVDGAPAGAQRYQPRTEGLFALIDHHNADGKDYWQVQTKDGLTSVYGSAAAVATGVPAVIADPRLPSAIFAWRVAETRDTFGNRILYEYFTENDSAHGHDGVQLYLRRIRYVDLSDPDAGDKGFFVSVELLYDCEAAPSGVTPEFLPRSRPDSFSDYRSGFEIRTGRRCKWIVIRTHPGASSPIPVRAYELVYLDEMTDASDALPINGASLLSRINVVGYDDAGIGSRDLPPLDFAFSRFTPQTRRFYRLQGRDLPATSLANPDMELVDLFGGGLPDLVELSGSAPRYWRNLGGGRFDLPREFAEAPAGLRLSDYGVQIIDANGDGRADLLVATTQTAGYFPLDFNGRFNSRSFNRYREAPSVNLKDPEVRLIDLTGDGVTDILRSGASFECYFNDPVEGWTAERTARVPRRRLEEFPDVSFADPRVKFADLSGDGLQDIAVIVQGRIDYWPNLGYGRFGARLTMPIPRGLPDLFDPQRVLLGDVDGDGLADLLYVSDGAATLWINRAGNGWSEPIDIRGAPAVNSLVTVRLTDLEGSGVAGLLWTREAGDDGAVQHFFLDFTGGVKPYLLARMDNNLGAVTEVTYSSSTLFFLRDQARADTRWRTTLPFPVQVVERVTVTDAISQGRLTTEYRYHHGYWDGVEREFRGFGMVEQLDTEVFDAYPGRALAAPADAVTRLRGQQSFSPPLLTRTWHHQGPVDPATGGPWQEIDGSAEFWSGDPDILDHVKRVDGFLAALPAEARREALRSLRGSILRTELYALDGSPLEDRPYTVTEHAYELREEAPPAAGSKRRRIFFPHAVAERTTQWERGDDPLTQLSFTSDYDAAGQPRRRVSAACPRGWRAPADRPQTPYLATLSLTRFAAPDEGGAHLLDRVAAVTTFEITGSAGKSLAEIRDIAEADPSLAPVGQSLTFYDGPAFEGLPCGQAGSHGAPVRTESLVLTDTILASAYSDERPPYLDPIATFAAGGDYPADFVRSLPANAGYVYRSSGAGSPHLGGWYAQASRRRFDFQSPSATTAPCGVLLAEQDPFGNETRIAYDAWRLLPVQVTGPTGLTTSAEYNPRVLQPAKVIDPNGNLTEVQYSPIALISVIFIRGKATASEGDATQPSLSMRYDLRAFCDRGQPISLRSLRRVCHDSDPDDTGETIETHEYSDGFGRRLQSRIQGESVRFGDENFGGGILSADQSAELGGLVQGRENNSAVEPNVVVSGWQRYDNKGRVVEKCEPFFDTGWEFRPEQEVQLGRRIRMEYDPRGQLVRTVNPDNSEQRVIFGVPKDLADPPLSPADSGRFTPTPWEAYTYDANDNAGRTHPGDPLHDSYRRHFNTPASAEIDALGRTIRAVARHRGKPDAAGNLPPVEEHITRSAYDIMGNMTGLRDALGRLAFEYVYDLAKHPLRSESIDAGRKRAIFDAAGKLVETRDAKGALQLHAYDALNRPVRLWARDAAGEPLTLREKLLYGDDPSCFAGAAARNQLGRLVEHRDEAGLVVIGGYDFKGNILDSARQALSDDFLLGGFRAELARPEAERDWTLSAPRIDWSVPGAEAQLGPAYTSRSAFDALSRTKWSDYPQSANGERYRLRPRYNRAGTLERVDLIGPLDGKDQGAAQSFVERIAYSAKGQRCLTVYGNGIMSRYAYDPDTFRLARWRTERFSPGAAGTAAYRPQGAPLQDIAYSYDLIGNSLGIRDVTPGCGVAGNPDALTAGSALGPLLAAGNALLRRFDYDPLYRLTSATGREAANIGSPRPWTDDARSGFNSGRHGAPDQDNAPHLTRLYQEDYDYDAAGNMLTLRHSQRTADGYGGLKSAVWSRRFGMGGRTPAQWQEEAARHLTGDWSNPPGNRLTHVEARSDGSPAPAAVPPSHIYDAAGNMVQEHTERRFAWDHADRMTGFRNQTGGSRPTIYALYLYDASGERVKKLVVTGNSYRTTVYLGGSFEHHARQNLDGSAKIENCSLHVMDDQSRIAILRSGPAFEDDGAQAYPVQYHLGDPLGSSVLVISGTGDWINREEFFPFGETSFGSFGRKRYRFTGKERDEESGLSYHAARYYATWIARWAACDPAGTIGNLNLYVFVNNNPINYVDPGGCQEVDILSLSASSQTASLPDYNFAEKKAEPIISPNKVGAGQQAETAEPSKFITKDELPIIRPISERKTDAVDEGNKFKPSKPRELTVGDRETLLIDASLLAKAAKIAPFLSERTPALGMVLLMLSGRIQAQTNYIEELRHMPGMAGNPDYDYLINNDFRPLRNTLAKWTKGAEILDSVGVGLSLLGLGRDFLRLGEATAYGTSQQVDEAAWELGSNSYCAALAGGATLATTPLGGGLVGGGCYLLVQVLGSDQRNWKHWATNPRSIAWRR